MLLLTVPDVDAAYQRAVAAGGVSIEKPANRPPGGRRAAVKDLFGKQWYFASPLKKTRR